MVKNGCGHLVHEILKFAVNEFVNSADFLHTSSDAIIFG